MKTTKTICFVLYGIGVLLLFFGHEIQPYFPVIWKVTAIVALLWFYFCITMILFTYYFQKRVYLVGIKGQKELKRHIGLKRLGVSFGDYRRYIYTNRFKSKDEMKDDVDFMELYPVRTKIKHVSTVILFSILYSFILVYVLPTGFTKITVPILAFVVLLFILDFSVIRIRYEESIFKSKTYNGAAKEMMKQSGITTH